MATIYRDSKADVLIKDKWEARDDYESLKTDLSIMFFFSLILFFVSPLLSSGLLLIAVMRYYNFYEEYFMNKYKKDKYKAELSPQLAYKTYINVGYEVPQRELEKHIEILKKLDAKDKEAQEYLKKREKLVKTSLKHYLVGISKNQLTTHFWMIGTTGAGKTSLIMQLTKLLAELGGGMMFIDGKADTKMVFKMYNLLKNANREQDFYLINFLPKENFREHTNTFNPLADMNHSEIVEFLMSAKGEASGDQAYWAERGKALLQAIVYPLYYRKKYFGEKFTIVTINNYLSDIEKFIFMIILSYISVVEMEEYLQSRSELKSIYEIARQKKTPDQHFPYLDAVTYYFNLFPYEKQKVKDLDIQKLSLLYESYLIASSYTKQISSDLWSKIAEKSLNFLKMLREKDKSVLSMKIEEINQLYEEFNKGGKGINYAQLQQALQQHAYAQQQWTSIFGTLMQYSNVFGSNEPEIDLVDVLRNNKFLYVLLPALAGSNQTTNMLGKIVLAAIRKAISTALGEAVEGLNEMQRGVLQRRITPIPLGLLVLDEYGAYPIKGLDTILAQVRSINISTIVATQDYTSGRAEGQDENAVKRLWGNSQKIILRIKDNETLKAVEESLPQAFKVKYSYILSPEDNYIHRKVDNVSLEKEKVIDPAIATAFKNGLGLFIVDDRPVVTQIFWADSPEAQEIYLNHSIQ